MPQLEIKSRWSSRSALHLSSSFFYCACFKLPTSQTDPSKATSLYSPPNNCFHSCCPTSRFFIFSLTEIANQYARLAKEFCYIDIYIFTALRLFPLSACWAGLVELLEESWMTTDDSNNLMASRKCQWNGTDSRIIIWISLSCTCIGCIAMRAPTMDVDCTQSHMEKE